MHDQRKPLNVLKGIHRALKSDGIYLMQDISGTGHVHKDAEHPVSEPCRFSLDYHEQAGA